ncbi:hypothetical protein TRVA0_032S01288 [Trichomonascus vanleenenianus]|uniref:Nur1p n=1 Tax=Trichomonascus vanleenenianus TaxID=2268995 RepID=UPI003ECAC813
MAQQRRIRKQPLLKRIQTAPFDLWLSLSESFELVNWDEKSTTVAVPAGAVCSGLLLLCRIYSSLSQDDNAVIANSLFRSQPKASDVFSAPKRRPFLTVLFSTLSLCLVVLCVLNTTMCYNKKRTYRLMGRSIDNAPNTPSAHKVTYEDPSKLQTVGSPLRRMTMLWTDTKKTESVNEQVWELTVWDPPRFNLYFGCAFSPLHCLYILYGPLGLFQIVFIAALTASLLGISHVFLTLIKDRSILHSEVLGEYNKKVVQPTYASRRDVAVGTDGSVETFSPSPKKYVVKDVRKLRDVASPLTPTRSSSSAGRFSSPDRSSLRRFANHNATAARYKQQSTTTSRSTSEESDALKSPTPNARFY